MQSLKILLLGAAIGSATALPAAASSSSWYNSEGGKVRLVTSGKADAAGRIQGVLDIALKPGWKTYWRDPGDAGVPPQLDISGSTNIADARFHSRRSVTTTATANGGYDHRFRCR